MKRKSIVFLLFFISCTASRKQQINSKTNYLKASIEKPEKIPLRENFYIYIMAGQSNMAGRAIVQPEDTVSSSQVLVLNKNNEWIYAKEPLHYYEPARTGLDCGLSFGKKLSELMGKKITIGLIPCAVGGSSIEQWLGDSTYRDVSLYSNLLSKVKVANQSGIIKGMLWHQGETNAGNRGYKSYKQKLESFFTKARKDIGYSDLPVYAGQLASFLSRVVNPFADSVNKDLQDLSKTMKNIYIIKTGDLSPKTDSIHFDSRSQRTMGKRFAEAVYKNQ